MDPASAAEHSGSRESVSAEELRLLRLALDRVRYSDGREGLSAEEHRLFRRTLNRGRDSEDANLERNIESTLDTIGRLSTIFDRAARNHWSFNDSANDQRRREIISAIYERLSNEWLSRILQVPVTDDGALDLFRAIRRALIYTIATEGEVYEYGPVPISDNPQYRQPPLRTALVGNAIMSIDDSRSPVPRRNFQYYAARAAPRPVVGSPSTRGLDSIVTPGDTSQALVLYNRHSINHQVEDFWTNIREQQEKKHIRQEIEAIRYGTLLFVQASLC